ncbi:MAG: rimI [Rhizobium sp.]|nr:rimI [Rhizobium sp.]
MESLMSIVRSAREEDAAELAAVAMRAWESAVTGWVDTGLLRANAERAFVDFTRRAHLAIDVAEQGGQVTGWAARENFDNHITDLWIDPIWQGQGFGQKLLAKLEEEIGAQGYETVKIETHSENLRAIEFLKRRGYSISWMTAAWSPQLDRDVDTIGMVKAIAVKEKQLVYAEF